MYIIFGGTIVNYPDTETPVTTQVTYFYPTYSKAREFLDSTFKTVKNEWLAVSPNSKVATVSLRHFSKVLSNLDSNTLLVAASRGPSQTHSNSYCRQLGVKHPDGCTVTYTLFLTSMDGGETSPNS